MRAPPFNPQGAGLLQEGHHWSTSFNKKKNQVQALEPTSVLDSHRSPSPPTSTSTFSSSDMAAVSNIKKEDWATELHPIPDSLVEMGGLGLDDWEAIFSDSSALFHAPMELDTKNADLGSFGFGVLDSRTGFQPIQAIGEPSSIPASPNVFFHENVEEKHNLVGPGASSMAFTPQPDSILNQSFPLSYPVPYLLQQRPMKPKPGGEEAALLDQILKAAELVEAGDSGSACGILARLNHQLPCPLGKPLLRSAFYFKEALHLLVNSTMRNGLATPWEVLLKLGAYKDFSEVLPLVQFTNFTCTQALLEELGGSDRIHIIDFDIGVGLQWSSFMQEIAHGRSVTAPMLKITAFVSHGTHHPLELLLIRDNLTQFATDLCIPFEFSILSLDSCDPAELLMSAGSGEAIAVNLPVGSHYYPPVPLLLRLVKQLSPKIVISIDHGCDRSDLSFSQHFLHAFQSCKVLLDSIDASGASSDVANKIERFLLQPRIEGAVLGRHRAGEKMLPWRMIFTSMGFIPMQFSNFTEAQAECLVKRVQVRGFHVEKRQSSLFLHWQHRELASVSAWRC